LTGRGGGLLIAVEGLVLDSFLRRFVMAVIRWEPVGELNTIQNEMNRLFNTFFDQPAERGGGERR
jgi:hypothetical protein